MFLTSLTGSSGAAAPPPTDLDGMLAVDEGPMRGELRRQIASLEREMSQFKALYEPWHRRRTTADRGPALLSACALERIRDEMLDARDAAQACVGD